MHTHTRARTQKAKPSAAVLAQSRLPSEPVLGHCDMCATQVPGVSQVNSPGTGLVTFRRLYHVAQVKVWAPKVPPRCSPTVCDMDNWLPANSKYPLMLQLGWLLPQQATRFSQTGAM